MVQIFELLARKSTSAVLARFLDRPTRETYAAGLIAELDISRKSVFDALCALEKSGMIERRAVGRMNQYRLRRDDSRARQLKTLRTMDMLVPMLEGMRGSGTEVYLYGSAARGEDSEGSDIDLLFIGEMPERSRLAKIEAVERIKPLYLSFLEYSSLARKDKPFYERIEKDRIRLV